MIAHASAMFCKPFPPQIKKGETRFGASLRYQNHMLLHVINGYEINAVADHRNGNLAVLILNHDTVIIK